MIAVNANKKSAIDVATQAEASFDTDTDRADLVSRLKSATPAQIKNYVSGLSAVQQKTVIAAMLILLRKLVS